MWYWKHLRPHSVGMTAPWNISLSPPPLLILPLCLPSSLPLICGTLSWFYLCNLFRLFTRLLRFINMFHPQHHSCVSHFVAHLHTFVLLLMHIRTDIWVWQGHVKFTLIRGSGQAGYRRKLNSEWQGLVRSQGAGYKVMVSKKKKEKKKKSLHINCYKFHLFSSWSQQIYLRNRVKLHSTI